MKEIIIQSRKENLHWDYDRDADVLYISSGEPHKALGVDIGEGTIVKYIESTGEVVGLTLIGIRRRVQELLLLKPGIEEN